MRSNPTPAEALLWSRLRRRQVEGMKFRRQHIIAGFIVDFYCPALTLAVEVDGPIHRYRARIDRWRDNILEAYGVRIIRFNAQTVLHDIDGVVSTLRLWIQRKTHSAGRG